MMDTKKKQKFLKWYNLSISLNSNYYGHIEEGQNGYMIYVYNFEDFIDILNLLGQIAAQFNIGYGYEEDPSKITDYQIMVIDFMVIDFDENFQQRSTKYI